MQFTSKHTRTGFYIIILGVFTELFIGLSYILSSIPSDRKFSTISLIQAIGALVGVYAYDYYYNQRIKLLPKSFSSLKSNTLQAIIFGLGSLFIAQLLIAIPLSIPDAYQALALMFAGPTEEVIFRGLILTPFITNDFNISIATPTAKGAKGFPYFKIDFSKGKVSVGKLFGLIISSLLFMAFHVNYYNDYQTMFGLFVGGLLLGIVYIRYENLTANVLAHFGWNTLISIRTYWVVIF
jgi:membrane protease YdiL (CAAX protease family)